MPSESQRSSLFTGAAGAMFLTVLTIYPPPDWVRPWLYTLVALLLLLGALAHPLVMRALKRRNHMYATALVFVVGGAILATVFHFTSVPTEVAAASDSAPPAVDPPAAEAGSPQEAKAAPQPTQKEPVVDEKPPTRKVVRQQSGNQSPNIVGNNNTVTYSAGPANEDIRSITIEGRLTATLVDGAELPPSSVPFMPIGPGAEGKLIGPLGEFTLNYVSPTVFRRLEGNRIVVVNTFSLPASSGLVGRLVSSLQSLEQVHVPVVTIVYGNALDEYLLGEVTVSVNGRSPWYYAWKMPQDKFQNGLILRFPLKDPANPFK